MKLACITILTLMGFSALDGASAEALRHPAPGRKINVFLFAGQSNMEGRADGGKLAEADRSRLRKVQDRIQLAFNRESIHPLDPVATSAEIREIYLCDTIFGPELFFGIALAEAWPDEQFLFIKQTAGATSLHGAWNPQWRKEKAAATEEEEAPKLYGELVAYTREVLGEYKPEEYKLCAMLWVQGESDAKFPEASAAYGCNLTSLIQHIRKDTGRNDLPFLLFEVGNAEIVEQMNRTGAIVTNVSLIPQRPETDSPDFYEKLENGHYNHEGIKKLGLRFAEVFLKNYSGSHK